MNSHKRFYQYLADSTGILWEFHKILLDAGSVPFAAVWEGSHLKQFDPQQLTATKDEASILKEYARSIQRSMDLSFQRIFEVIGDQKSGAFLFGKPIPEAAVRFIHPYARHLLELTNDLVADQSRAVLHRLNLRSEMSAGLHTGTRATVQLVALLGESFDPKTVVELSRVSLGDVSKAFLGIGLPAGLFAESNYALITASGGLERGMLRKLGLGKTVGCPAGIPISDQTRQFLSGNCGIDAPRTMLADFARFVQRDYHETILSWWERLPQSERSCRVAFVDRTIISGDVGERIGFGCPERR